MLDVLVADDDPEVREAVVDALRCAGHRVTEASDGAAAVDTLADHVFDLAICDVCMPRVDGHALLRRIRRESPGTSVVMMTSFASVSDVVDALHEGAVNYLAKPFDVEELIASVVEPLDERRAIAKKFEAARDAFVARTTGAALVTRIPADEQPRDAHQHGRVKRRSGAHHRRLGDRQGARGADHPCPGLAARGAARGDRRLRDADLMEASLEQELLVERGRRDAWFRAASGGTLVVDGIDRLPARTQSELRRVLDEPATRARRGPSWEPLGVRVLSLSREALTGKVASGEFLDALHYRVSASHLHVPTLQERAEDLYPLVAELLRELTPPSTTPPRISPVRGTQSLRHEFKGNVRELRWTLERALVQSSGDEGMDTPHLPPQMLPQRP